jgi:hypothetical protein
MNKFFFSFNCVYGIRTGDGGESQGSERRDCFVVQ